MRDHMLLTVTHCWSPALQHNLAGIRRTWQTTGGGGFVCLPLGCLALDFFLAILKRVQITAVARRQRVGCVNCSEANIYVFCACFSLKLYLLWIASALTTLALHFSHHRHTGL